MYNIIKGENMNNKYIDKGQEPFTLNIEKATLENENYRTTLWTGEKLQLTVMAILPNDDIGLEIHPTVDQFLRVEQGTGICKMGKTKDNLIFSKKVKDNDAIFVPANTWHNIENIGEEPLKLYTIYAHPNHLKGTIHKTHQDAKDDPNED